MIASDGDVQLGGNVELARKVRNGILVSFKVFSTQSLLHECLKSFGVTLYDSDHHINKIVDAHRF